MIWFDFSLFMHINSIQILYRYENIFKLNLKKIQFTVNSYIQKKKMYTR